MIILILKTSGEISANEKLTGETDFTIYGVLSTALSPFEVTLQINLLCGLRALGG